MRALYFAVLGGCFIVTLPLELMLGVRVYRSPLRLALTVLPVLVVFLAWDSAAIHARQWTYRHLVGVRVGNVPVEEIAFFIVIPICAVLTLEAVRRRRPGWRIGDEPSEPAGR
jgi:lycopene cyclase domain-containing protein